MAKKNPLSIVWIKQNDISGAQLFRCLLLSQVIRLMPNTPCLVREGASVFSMGNAATLEDRDNVQKLFEAVGECHQVPEALIDAVTAMSGSGPAYMYMIIGKYERKWTIFGI